MESNPNKPRLWLDEDKTTVQSSARADERVKYTNLITEMTIGEQAEILCDDKNKREELLASLHGKRLNNCPSCGIGDV